ncbi:MAG: hypothetical protein ACRD1E_02545, partial [Terriglobales bacterium]
MFVGTANWNNLSSGLAGAVIGSIVGGLIGALAGGWAQHRLWSKDRRREEWRELLDAISKLADGCIALSRAEELSRRAASEHSNDKDERRQVAAESRGNVANIAEQVCRVATDRLFISDAKTSAFNGAAQAIWKRVLEGSTTDELSGLIGGLRTKAWAQAVLDLGIRQPGRPSPN